MPVDICKTANFVTPVSAFNFAYEFRSNLCCRFTRTWYFKITGCKCNADNLAGMCDHYEDDELPFPTVYAYF